MMRLAPLLLAAALASATLAACSDATDVPLETPSALTHNPLGPDPLAQDSLGTLSPDSLTGTYEGHYSAGFEHSGFIPCADTTEVWWTESAMTATPIAGDQTRLDMRPAADVHSRYTAAVGDSAGTFGHGVTVWMRVRGRATPRGDRSAGTGFGHLGAYTRAFSVDSVEEAVRDTVVAGCPAPHSVRP